jgi:hypothetical protein
VEKRGAAQDAAPLRKKNAKGKIQKRRQDAGATKEDGVA